MSRAPNQSPSPHRRVGSLVDSGLNNSRSQYTPVQMQHMKEAVNKKYREQLQDNLFKLTSKKGRETSEMNISLTSRLLKPTVASIAQRR